MACETCQDCSCDSITLPIAVGPPGPQGPAGINGVDGSEGGNVIFSSLTDSTINSNIMVDFIGKAYNLPKNTFKNNGDILKLTAWFSVTRGDHYFGNLEVYFGTGSILIPSHVLAFYPNVDSIKVEVTFNKVDDTTIIAQFDKKQSDSITGNILQGQSKYLKTGITVNNLISDVNVIKLRGFEQSSTSLTCNLMTIELYKYKPIIIQQ